jgi:hypothetical protein
MAEVTFTPLTEAAPALLNRFQAEAGIYPFRTTRDGARSYALGADTPPPSHEEFLLGLLRQHPRGDGSGWG